MDDMGYNTISGFLKIPCFKSCSMESCFSGKQTVTSLPPQIAVRPKGGKKSSLLMAKDCHWRRRANETDMLHRWALSTWHNNDDDVMI